MPDDEHLADRIRELIADEPGVTEKRMFRGLAFLIEGNMSVAASGRGGLLLQVDPAQTAALISRSNAEGTLMRGREMDSGLPSGGRSGAAQTPTGAPGGLRPTASTKA